MEIGLASVNPKCQVASDIPPDYAYLPPEKKTLTKGYLDAISDWTDTQEMIWNPEKCKIMIINFCKSSQFKTRLTINNSLIEQVNQTQLLGVILSEDMTWQANTDHLIKKSYILIEYIMFAIMS